MTKLAAAGYEIIKVSKIKCLNCREPIGKLPYQEVTTLARFGQMLFEHVECPVKSCLQCEQPLNGQWRIHDHCIRARIRVIAAEKRKENIL